MSNVLDELEESNENLYEILKLKKEADEKEIKKSYRKLALKCHPDKLKKDSSEEEKKNANILWQKISIAYDILSNEKSRTKYDKTGSVKESKDYNYSDDDFSWEKYFEILYGNSVDEEKISNFEKKYRFSEEEEKEVCDLYVKSKGDLEYIMDNIPLCTADDYPRFVEIIDKAIKEKKVKKYKKFNKDYKEAMKARKDFEEKEKQKFEKAKAKEKKSKNAKKEESIDDLALIIQNNRKRRMENVFDNLLEKYDKVENKKKKMNKNKKSPKDDLPSEEEFLKLQEKLFGKKK
ncbi:DnaJ-domain-containing protein [Piromyces finnis]|uniref:DnaJ-domain-containing protein n=1 Tax=Piromyces finnis TaxID=1754191 RepID=A0A1Y1VBW1_9FUNG|nr:DnaJ-domain-containing protein [Piromyces finnis]|eukprot:ORX51746.1 DnaJ-domain-containing protein [Piromyces finnis]